MDRKPIKIRPTTEQITQMDEVLEWLEVLEPWERKLVWKRGARIPWKVLSYEFGLHRSNLSRHYEKALVKILVEKILYSNAINPIYVYGVLFIFLKNSLSRFKCLFWYSNIGLLEA